MEKFRECIERAAELQRIMYRNRAGTATVSVDYNGNRARKCLKCHGWCQAEVFIVNAMCKVAAASSSNRHYASGWKFGPHHFSCWKCPSSITNINQIQGINGVRAEDRNKMREKVEAKHNKEKEEKKKIKDKIKQEKAEQQKIEDKKLLITDADDIRKSKLKVKGKLAKNVFRKTKVKKAEPIIEKAPKTMIKLDEEILLDMKVDELRNLLRKNGVVTSGTKTEMAKRYLLWESTQSYVNSQIKIFQSLQEKKDLNNNNENDFIDEGFSEELADEIWFMIFQYCDYKSLCKLSCTSWQFNRIASDGELWKELFRRDFTSKGEVMIKSSTLGWKELYRVNLFAVCFRCATTTYNYYHAPTKRVLKFRPRKIVAKSVMCDNHYEALFGTHGGKTSKTKIMSRINITEFDLDRLPIEFTPDHKMRLYDTTKGLKLQVYIYGSLEKSEDPQYRSLYLALHKGIKVDHLPTGQVNCHHVRGMEAEELKYRKIFEGYLAGTLTKDYTVKAAAHFVALQRKMKILEIFNDIIDNQNIFFGLSSIPSPEEILEENDEEIKVYLMNGVDKDAIAREEVGYFPIEIPNKKKGKKKKKDADIITYAYKLIYRYIRKKRLSLAMKSFEDVLKENEVEIYETEIYLSAHLLPNLCLFVNFGYFEVKDAAEADFSYFANFRKLIYDTSNIYKSHLHSSSTTSSKKSKYEDESEEEEEEEDEADDSFEDEPEDDDDIEEESEEEKPVKKNAKKNVKAKVVKKKEVKKKEVKKKQPAKKETKISPRRSTRNSTKKTKAKEEEEKEEEEEEDSEQEDLEAIEIDEEKFKEFLLSQLVEITSYLLSDKADQKGVLAKLKDATEIFANPRKRRAPPTPRKAPRKRRKAYSLYY